MNLSKELSGLCALVLSLSIVCIDKTLPLSSPAVNILINFMLSPQEFFLRNMFEFVYA